MRSRTFREGSVGLLLLLGLGMFGGIVLWVNRFTAASGSYEAVVEFAYAGGMQRGAAVQYRGVKVGNISAIRPKANTVEVVIEITKSDLIMPSDVLVEANQSGLISEAIIDIRPKEFVPSKVVAGPLDPKCNPQIIVCDGSRLKGEIGISIDQLIRSSTQLSSRYSDPEFYQNINQALENSSKAAASVADLSANLSVLSKRLQQELSSVSATSATIRQATNQLSTSTTRTLNQVSITANQLGSTAEQFGSTAEQFGSTAKEISLTTNRVNKLINSLDTLVTSNRSSLVTVLDNITATSAELRKTVSSLSPVVNRFTQGELLNNLETLSENAAQASVNLRQVTSALNDPKNVLVLQQTLDAARVTFDNAQKITSDLDELTGDPSFRDNLRQLVNGLSGLVSSTEEMQERVTLATTLDSVKAGVNNLKTETLTPKISQEKTKLNILPSNFPKNTEKTSQPTAVIFNSTVLSTNRQPTNSLPNTLNRVDKTQKPTQIIFTSPQSGANSSTEMKFHLSPNSIKNPDKTPQPTVNPVAPSSQENLLRQLRKHQQQDN
jgi:phospholipid/cholesterol/gamma-HCH transport system substrate-binding protein